MVFGNRLIEFFKNKRVSNRVLAKETGFSESMVGRYLKNPNLKFLIAVVEVYPDIDLNYILKDIEANAIIGEKGEKYGLENEDLLKIIEDATSQLRANLTRN